MVDGEAPLCHDFLQVTIRERISQVPTNTQDNDHVFEMSPAEQCRPFSGHAIPYQISSIAFATEPSALAREGQTPKNLLCLGLLTNVIPNEARAWRLRRSFPSLAKVWLSSFRATGKGIPRRCHMLASLLAGPGREDFAHGTMSAQHHRLGPPAKLTTLPARRRRGYNRHASGHHRRSAGRSDFALRSTSCRYLFFRFADRSRSAFEAPRNTIAANGRGRHACSAAATAARSSPLRR